MKCKTQGCDSPQAPTPSGLCWFCLHAMTSKCSPPQKKVHGFLNSRVDNPTEVVFTSIIAGNDR